MKVARLYDFGDIRIEDDARPEIGPDDILVRARACGICSGDIMAWYIPVSYTHLTLPTLRV